MLAPRVLEVAGLILLVWCSGRLALTFFGTRTVGYVGGAVAALMQAQLEFWHTAQPETFGGVLTFVALVLTTGEGRRARRHCRWLLVGVAFGSAAMLKPPILQRLLVGHATAMVGHRERVLDRRVGEAKRIEAGEEVLRGQHRAL